MVHKFATKKVGGLTHLFSLFIDIDFSECYLLSLSVLHMHFLERFICNYVEINSMDNGNKNYEKIQKKGSSAAESIFLTANLCNIKRSYLHYVVIYLNK